MNTTMNPAISNHASPGPYGMSAGSPTSPTGLESNFSSFTSRRQAAGSLPSFTLPPMTGHYQLSSTAPLSQSSYSAAMSPSHQSPPQTSPYGQHGHSPTHTSPFGQQAHHSTQGSSPYPQSTHLPGQPPSPFGQPHQAGSLEQPNYSHQPPSQSHDSSSYSHSSHGQGTHSSSQLSPWPRLGPLPSQPPAPANLGPYRPYQHSNGYSGSALQGMGGAVMSNVHAPGAPMTMIPGMPMGMSPYGAPMMYGQHHAAPPTERPFKCDQCPQSFSRNHDLKRHKRIHLSVKPFPCTYCDKSFSRKDALKRHRLVRGCEAMEKNDKDDKKMGEKRDHNSMDGWEEDSSEASPSKDSSPS